VSRPGLGTLDAGTGSEGAIEGNGRANASRMIVDSHDQLLHSW
jgi:hypothetical protein